MNIMIIIRSVNNIYLHSKNKTKNTIHEAKESKRKTIIQYENLSKKISISIQ